MAKQVNTAEPASYFAAEALPWRILQVLWGTFPKENWSWGPLAGLGWAGLDSAGLGWAGLGWIRLETEIDLFENGLGWAWLATEICLLENGSSGWPATTSNFYLSLS